MAPGDDERGGYKECSAICLGRRVAPPTVPYSLTRAAIGLESCVLIGRGPYYFTAFSSRGRAGFSSPT